MVIKDKQTGKVIGNVITNRSMTFEEAMESAGFKYVEGNESGWTKDGGRTVYDDSTAEMDYNA